MNSPRTRSPLESSPPCHLPGLEVGPPVRASLGSPAQGVTDVVKHCPSGFSLLENGGGLPRTTSSEEATSENRFPVSTGPRDLVLEGRKCPEVPLPEATPLSGASRPVCR